MWHLKWLCNILLGFPDFQGPSLVNLTHFQSWNCDRLISAWKEGQETGRIEPFKVGQYKRRGGNVKRSLDCCSDLVWVDLKLFVFTEWREAYFVIKERLAYRWPQPLAELKQLKRIDLRSHTLLSRSDLLFFFILAIAAQHANTKAVTHAQGCAKTQKQVAINTPEVMALKYCGIHCEGGTFLVNLLQLNWQTK